MEDNMNMKDTMEIKEVEKKEDPLEGIDRETATKMLRKVGEAVINEYNAMIQAKEMAKSAREKLDGELDELEKKTTDLVNDIQVQSGVVKTLQSRIESEKDDNTILSLMVIRDETLEQLQGYKTQLDECQGELKRIENSMNVVKTDEARLDIGAETLINFGLKYGLVSKKDE